jgi:hypothetical protein
MAWPKKKPNGKAPHHKGSHQVTAKAITDAAYRDPSTRCWRCGNTLPNCRRHKNGKPPTWQAGHLVDGQEGGPMAAECSPCNTSSGARLANLRAKARRARQREQKSMTVELSPRPALFSYPSPVTATNVDPPAPPGW